MTRTQPEGMTRKRLAEIRERAEKATPGPWGTWEKSNGTRSVLAPLGTVLISCDREEDMKFIAVSRTDVPALCDALERVVNLLRSGHSMLGHCDICEFVRDWEG